MEQFGEIFAIAGGAILGPLFAGAFLLAASQALYNKFVNPKADWGKNLSRRFYLFIVWITGAIFFLIFFLIVHYRS